MRLIEIGYPGRCEYMLSTRMQLMIQVEVYYHLSDSQAAMIFPTAVVGYVLAALTVPFTISRTGWRGIAVVSPIFHVVSAAILATGPPLGMTLVAMFVGGIAAGFSDVGFNSWASKLPFPNVIQGFMVCCSLPARYTDKNSSGTHSDTGRPKVRTLVLLLSHFGTHICG